MWNVLQFGEALKSINNVFLVNHIVQSFWPIFLSPHLKLNNLTIVYDNNMSHPRGLQIQNPDEKFRAFGCDVAVVNGHDVDSLKAALDSKADTVRVIVANTKKGFGCRTLIENQYEWHRKSPNDEEFEKLMAELDEETV